MPESAREHIDLVIYEGVTFSNSYRWETQAATPVPISLADYTGVMHIRKEIADEAPLLELTTENGGIVIESPAANGVFTIRIEAEDTEGICEDHETIAAVYDLMLEKTGERILQQYGKVRIIPSVTRPE
jgi:hypothetical protein